MEMQGPPDKGSVSQARVVFGLVVMLIGATLLIERLDWLWGFDFDLHLWPLILIVLGLARLTDPKVDADGLPRVNRSGVWLMFVGFWGLLNEYRWFGLYYDRSWPLLVMGAGAMVVWRAMDPVTCARPVRRQP
jgi:hypothetical protein